MTEKKLFDALITDVYGNYYCNTSIDSNLELALRCMRNDGSYNPEADIETARNDRFFGSAACTKFTSGAVYSNDIFHYRIGSKIGSYDGHTYKNYEIAFIYNTHYTRAQAEEIFQDVMQPFIDNKSILDFEIFGGINHAGTTDHTDSLIYKAIKKASDTIFQGTYKTCPALAAAAFDGAKFVNAGVSKKWSINYKPRLVEPLCPCSGDTTLPVTAQRVHGKNQMYSTDVQIPLIYGFIIQEFMEMFIN
jgi:hypothetical protein